MSYDVEEGLSNVCLNERDSCSSEGSSDEDSDGKHILKLERWSFCMRCF